MKYLTLFDSLNFDKGVKAHYSGTFQARKCTFKKIKFLLFQG